MDPPTFDLQSHSLHSDGALPPREVVQTAAAAGVELLSLSDHDTVDGVQEARDAAQTQGIELVTAVEISAVDEVDQDLHVLGYQVDHQDALLLERLEDYRSDRERRSGAMAQALHELGFELDEEVIERRVQAGKPVGRPHIAHAVVSNPVNAQRLAKEGCEEASAFLERYLIEGKPAFRPRVRPTVPEAIDAIHDAGGLAVWAHPFWNVQSPERVQAAVRRFHDAGLNGVECFYVTHTAPQTMTLARQCEELGLLSTGSSDFHGPRHRLFSKFRAFSTYGISPTLGPLAGGRVL